MNRSPEFTIRDRVMIPLSDRRSSGALRSLTSRDSRCGSIACGRRPRFSPSLLIRPGPSAAKLLAISPAIKRRPRHASFGRIGTCNRGRKLAICLAWPRQAQSSPDLVGANPFVIKRDEVAAPKYLPHGQLSLASIQAPCSGLRVLSRCCTHHWVHLGRMDDREHSQ